MIYTITLNPSIDFIVKVNKLNLGETNRTYFEEFQPGGKGIMVSKLLKNIGTESVNLGFLGGFTAKFIEDSLDTMGIRHNFNKVSEDTRINIKLKEEKETEINTQGPLIRDIERQEFLKKIDKIKKEDFVIISGSLPRGLEIDFYVDIIKILEKNHVKYSIDTSGEALKKVLCHYPYLIKPNKDEIQYLADNKLKTFKDLINFARENLLDKAENIIISLGGDGAVFIKKDYYLFAKAVKGEIINTVGAGDSLVAGFIDAKIKQKEDEKSFRFAIACATATAFSIDIGKLELISEIENKIEIERLNYEY